METKQKCHYLKGEIIMKNLKLCIKIGELVRNIKKEQDWINDYVNKRDQNLEKLNELLITNGGKKISLEDVLSIEDLD